MRNPNGYGSVTKLSGKRRNPYMVKKVRDWNDKGHPIYDIIGYFPTRKEAMLKLAEYNANPYDLANDKITVSEMYGKLLELKGGTLGQSTLAQIKSVFNKHIDGLHDIAYKDIRPFHIESCISRCLGGSGSKANIKKLFAHLDKLALELDIIQKGYSQLVSVKYEPPTKSKKLFTSEEINLIKSQPPNIYRDCCLILLYTGARISEILQLSRENIHLEDRYIITGIKTVAGKNRIIPIHDEILPLIRYYYDKGEETPFKRKLSSFNLSWDTYFKKLNMEHTRHECRHTFRSRLHSLGADAVTLNKLMGHTSGNTGDDVYTHKSLEELRSVINLLCY